MTLADLTAGDTVVKQTATSAADASGGDVKTYADTATLTCTIQTMAASESRKYEARGSRFNYIALFSADPTLTTNNRLKWTIRAGNTLSTPIYLKVFACYPEGPPGEDQLWVADCGQETTENP